MQLYAATWPWQFILHESLLYNIIVLWELNRNMSTPCIYWTMIRCKLMSIIMLKLIQPHHILLAFLVHSDNTSPTPYNCSPKTQFTQTAYHQYHIITAQNPNSLKWHSINTSQSKLLHRNQWNHYHNVVLQSGMAYMYNMQHATFWNWVTQWG